MLNTYSADQDRDPSISGVEFESCYAEKERIRIEEIEIPVISLARLRENKGASGRAKDLADLEGLLNWSC